MFGSFSYGLFAAVFWFPSEGFLASSFQSLPRFSGGLFLFCVCNLVVFSCFWLFFVFLFDVMVGCVVWFGVGSVVVVFLGLALTMFNSGVHGLLGVFLDVFLVGDFDFVFAYVWCAMDYCDC